jgi:hypothetical protein
MSQHAQHRVRIRTARPLGVRPEDLFVPPRSVGFPACRIADFQIGWASQGRGRSKSADAAGLETRDANAPAAKRESPRRRIFSRETGPGANFALSLNIRIFQDPQTWSNLIEPKNTLPSVVPPKRRSPIGGREGDRITGFSRKTPIVIFTAPFFYPVPPVHPVQIFPASVGIIPGLSTLPRGPEKPAISITKICENPSKNRDRQPPSTLKTLWGRPRNLNPRKFPIHQHLVRFRSPIPRWGASPGRHQMSSNIAGVPSILGVEHPTTIHGPNVRPILEVGALPEPKTDERGNSRPAPPTKATCLRAGGWQLVGTWLRKTQFLMP